MSRIHEEKKKRGKGEGDLKSVKDRVETGREEGKEEEGRGEDSKRRRKRPCCVSTSSIYIGHTQ